MKFCQARGNAALHYQASLIPRHAAVTKDLSTCLVILFYIVCWYLLMTNSRTSGTQWEISDYQ
jgi:hypothetical protein